MIARIRATVGRWTRPSEAEREAQPLLAGYRRAPPRALAALLLVAAAASFLALGIAFGVYAPARMTPFSLPFVLLGALILWCLPAGEYAPTRAIEPLFLGFFAALLMWPNYLAVAIANLPWMTLLRITGTPLVILFLACISISRSFRGRLKDILQGDVVMFRLVVALAGLWTFSLLMTSELGSSLNRYALALVNLIGIFFVSCFLFSRRGFADVWVRMLVIMLLVVCGTAVWEYQRQSLPWAGHIPPFLRVDDPVVQRILASGFNRIEIYRAKGTATTPLGLGEILGLAMPFAMHLLLGRYNLAMKVLGAIAVPVFAGTILLTDSRLGFVAGCASALFYFLIWAVLRWRRDKSSIIAPAIVLAYPAMFATFMAATFFVTRLKNKFWGSGQQQYSTQSRLDQWEHGIPKIIANPFGYGIGRAGPVLGWTNLAGTPTIDSYWLSVILEIGVVGFIVFYGLMFRGAYTAARTVLRKEGDRESALLVPMAVALLNFVIVKMVFSQDANHPFIFMILGAVVALTYRANLSLLPKDEASPKTQGQRQRIRLPFFRN